MTQVSYEAATERLSGLKGEEMFAEAQRIAKANGSRMPTVREVIAGWVAVLQEVGLTKPEVMLLTLAAAQAAKLIVDEAMAESNPSDIGD